MKRLWLKLVCYQKGHSWIVQTKFNPPPLFQDGAAQLKFNLLLMGAVLMGLPEFGILAIGITDVERICVRCGRYEKGSLFGEATVQEASTKPLKITSVI